MLGYMSDMQLTIVMVAYDGDLAGLIGDHGYQLSCISFASQITHALRECHKYGVVHCDLKPENLLWKY